MNIKSKELLFIFGHPKTELKGIYGKHKAHSFENIILLITEIEYFTSFYQVMVVLMFIRAAY